MSEFIEDVMQKLKSSKNHQEALDILFEESDKGNFSVQNGVIFKHGEYLIQNAFKNNGEVWEENLKIMSSLELDITPQYIDTIIKDNDMFIVMKIKGTAKGNLEEFFPYDISDEAKLKAYDDLYAITEAGFVDEKIIKSCDMWYVTPDDKRIVLPCFEELRQITADEKEKILERYRKILKI